MWKYHTVCYTGMRALLTLWWWQWVTSVHERLHTERDAQWDTYRPEKGYLTDPSVRWWSSTPPDTTVNYGSDNG